MQAPHIPLAARVSAVVLLGGTLRAQDFHRALRRPLVSLPLSETQTMWSRWHGAAASLAESSAEPAPVRLDLLVGDPADAPSAQAGAGTVRAGSFVDRGDVRGTAGVLRDHIEHTGATGFVLVANANQAVLGDFPALVRTLASGVRDITLMTSTEGNGGFLMLARAECLLAISTKGFVDLKEQALPMLARNHDVRVVHAPLGAGPTSVRSHGDYLRLVARLHSQPPSDRPSSIEDRFGLRFRLVEQGATVAPDAVIQNSVVLRDGSVSPGAAVAWSVVTAGANVAPGSAVRNKLVSP